MIPNTPSLCNNIMSRTSLNIQDAHSQKGKQKSREKERPCQSDHVHGCEVDIATQMNHMHTVSSKKSTSSPQPLQVLPGTTPGSIQSRLDTSMRDDT